MPTLIRRSPFELKGYENAKKRVYKTLKESNMQSGFAGTPIADADSYSALIKIFDELEVELDVYVTQVDRFVEYPTNTKVGNEPNPTDVEKKLFQTKKIVNKISLGALPQSDIQILQDFKTSILGGFGEVLYNLKTKTQDLLQIILPPTRQTQRFTKSIQDIEASITVILSEISNVFTTLDSKFVAYNAGVAQPMTGGYLGELKYEVYNGLRNMPMYQTMKYNVA
jgi:hypothetical protein